MRCASILAVLFLLALAGIVAWQQPWHSNPPTGWSNGPTVIQLEQLHEESQVRGHASCQGV